MVSFLVLDYNRPQELLLCLESIKRNAFFEHKTIVLSNGGDPKPAQHLFSKGYMDQLILNKVNNGGGYGTTGLFRACNTEFAIYVQEDQVLAKPLNQSDIDQLTFFLNEYRPSLSEPKYAPVIGLAGDQCQGNYSERAQFVMVDWYNREAKNAPNGGPGPFHHLMHNEEYFQRYFKSHDMTFKIWSPFFADNGKRSFREYPCGGKTLHYTDTKELFVIVPPKQKYVFPSLTDAEWDKVIAGQWQDGTIPENDKPHSFVVWNQ